MKAELRAACDDYLGACFNEDDRNQIESLIKDQNVTELQRRMFPRITFGTSGLRAKMQAGFSGMNDLTVYQASLGLRDYVLASVPEAATRGIVIGHDHRHNSQRFAQIVEAVFAPVMKVYIFGVLVHTPLVPFSVRHFEAACGVMITASHNPKDDNGYKVYWQNSCAIIPPHDHAIAEAIVDATRQLPVTKPEFGLDHSSVENVYERAVKAYFGAIFATATNAPESLGKSPFRFCYTAMHGVGLIYARIAMSDAQNAHSTSEMVVVAEQALPDPDFSTVKFPNPEEAGALDIAMQTADNEGINIVVATDPDADRLGAAEKVGGVWRVLTGNQIGVLIASEMIRASDASQRRAMLSSAVSSRMLESMGKLENIHWDETLTGFKWLGNRALTLKEEGYEVILAYEEALGFMPYDVVYDKDGILSMTVLLRLAKSLYAQNKTLTSELEDLYKKYGFYSSANSYFVMREPSEVSKLMSVLRQPHYPTSLGNRKVSRVRDLTAGYDSSTEDNKPTLPISAGNEMITFWFQPSDKDQFTSATMTIRGSGTEPKLKYYIEAQAGDTATASTAASGIEKDLSDEWFKAFTLQKP